MNLLFSTFMFLGTYEPPRGPENFESVSILLCIIICQVLIYSKLYLDEFCGLRARNRRIIKIPSLYLDLNAPQGHQKSDIHINAAIVPFTID